MNDELMRFICNLAIREDMWAKYKKLNRFYFDKFAFSWLGGVDIIFTLLLLLLNNFLCTLHTFTYLLHSIETVILNERIPQSQFATIYNWPLCIRVTCRETQRPFKSSFVRNKCNNFLTLYSPLVGDMKQRKFLITLVKLLA